MLRAAAVRGRGDAHGHILPMESQESHVAIIAAIRPDEEERIEKVLDKALAHGAPHNGALAARALIYSFGEEEFHGWFEASVLCNTRVPGASTGLNRGSFELDTSWRSLR
jgi:hypothetical protein